MTTSGTYALSLENADFIDEAMERCGIDPATLTARHLRSARRSLDLLFAEWSNLGVHLWAVDEQTQTVTDGDSTYTFATGSLAILDMVVRRSGVDTPVEPMARDEYAAIPDKTTEGLPSRYWLDRATGIYTLWTVPENSTDVIHYWRMRQLQDAGTAAQTPDVPYRWYEALTAGLAKKLAEKYAPEREGALSNKAKARFLEASQEDRERTPTRFRMGRR